LSPNSSCKFFFLEYLPNYLCKWKATSFRYKSDSNSSISQNHISWTKSIFSFVTTVLGSPVPGTFPQDSQIVISRPVDTKTWSHPTLSTHPYKCLEAISPFCRVILSQLVFQFYLFLKNCEHHDGINLTLFKQKYIVKRNLTVRKNTTFHLAVNGLYVRDNN
jgi:hypothetical protein